MPFSPSKSPSFFYWVFEMTITQEEIKEIVKYSQETGVFIWISSRSNKIKIGDTAGNIWINQHNRKKYHRLWLSGRLYLAHRVAWIYMTGSWPNDQIDHIDGNGLNNKWENLREVSGSENQQNTRMKRTNTTGICGVVWNKNANKWQAAINIYNKAVYLGLFENIFDAACARKNAEVKYGFHKNHGSNRPL